MFHHTISHVPLLQDLTVTDEFLSSARHKVMSEKLCTSLGFSASTRLVTSGSQSSTFRGPQEAHLCLLCCYSALNEVVQMSGLAQRVYPPVAYKI